MGRVLQKSFGILIWHPNDANILVQGEGAGDAGRADRGCCDRPWAAAHDPGAPHSPISARSCSDTFTRRGWGGKAEQKHSSAPAHSPRAASRAGRSWGYGAHARATLKPAWKRVPCAPAPSPCGNFCSRRGESWGISHTERPALIPAPNTQPPPEQRNRTPLLPRGPRAPGALRGAPGAPSSLPGPSSPACAKLPGTGAAAVVQRVGTRLTQLLAPMRRNQQQQSNVSDKNTIKKTPIPVQGTRHPTLAFQLIPCRDKDSSAGSQPSPALTAFLSRKMFQMSFPKTRESLVVVCWQTSVHK